MAAPLQANICWRKDIEGRTLEDEKLMQSGADQDDGGDSDDDEKMDVEQPNTPVRNPLRGPEDESGGVRARRRPVPRLTPLCTPHTTQPDPNCPPPSLVRLSPHSGTKRGALFHQQPQGKQRHVKQQRPKQCPR